HRALSEHKTLSISWSHYPFVEPFVAGLILLFHFHIPHGDITGSRMPPAGRGLRLLRVNG
ncbi:hypothetical protein RNP22_22510, partial [Escherichia coli]|nr:hypothetical protein [Escherichia coli]